jgi:ferredoxin-nitrite reductase
MIAHSQGSQSIDARDPSQTSMTLGDVVLPIAEREGGEDVLQQSEPLVCPGLFYATPAQDGAIYRIRTPAGALNSEQARVVAHFAEQMGDGYLQITNRANLQIRSIHMVAPPSMLSTFQDVGLAAPMSKVDHLRNIMASPTAGIDSQALIDTRPLVMALDNTIVQHEEFAGLPAKFSVGFDGGEVVSVRHHPNDIWLVATADRRPGVGEHLCTSFRLLFNAGQGRELDTGLQWRPEECVPLVVAIAQVYLTHVERRNAPVTGKKPRLRQVIAQQGITWYLEQLRRILPFTLPHHPVPVVRSADVAPHSRHIGAHPQRQQGLSYLGVVAPLGRLAIQQLQALADLAQVYGSGTLRLTPWQNVLIPDVPSEHVPALHQTIEQLGLHTSATHPWGALVACTGNRGCHASATDTTGHALELANHLAQHGHLDQPVNIHLSGCTKSCAQHHKSDIALLGITLQQGEAAVEGYRVHVGAGEQPFGRVLSDAVPAADIPALMARLLQVYRDNRHTVDESFGDFAERYSIPSLQELSKQSPGDGTASHD